MNISELSAKIKITVEQQELAKLNDALEEVKKKIKEFSKRVDESQEKQKKSSEQTEKVAEKTEEAAKATEKQADATEDLADKTKKATSEMHGFMGVLSRVVHYMQKLLLAGFAGGTVLERMYEKAGKLGASLRLMSTDFSLDPESLQKWQMMAEQAGVSSDAMERMLSTATEMKRLAVQNPAYLPDALNIAGIRPANYRTPEALMKAILSTSLRFRDEQKRMAWLDAAGFKDAAAANLIAKQYAKGGAYDNAFFLSNENVEKLRKVKIAISTINRLSESVKNNFLAAISDEFVAQIESICKYVIDTVHSVEKFMTRHGGFKKVLSDIGGLASKVSSVANGFAAAFKFISQFGALTVLIAGFGVALGVVLKIVDSIVASFQQAVSMAGTLRQFIAGFVAMKIGEMIDSGSIAPEYVEDAKKLQSAYLKGAGVYQDPKMVSKTLNNILEWITGIPAKIANALVSVLESAMFKAIDYLIDSILTLWADSQLPFSDWAKEALFNRYIVRPDRTPEQKEFVKNYIQGIQKETDTAEETGRSNRYFRSGNTPFSFATEEQSAAVDLAKNLIKLTDYGRNLHNLSKSDAIRVQSILEKFYNKGYIDYTDTGYKEIVQYVNNNFNFSDYTKDMNLTNKVKEAATEGSSQGFKQGMKNTAGVM